MGTDGPPNAKETKAKLDYLKELLTDRTILASDPHVYIHLGKILEQEILRIRSSLFSTYGIYTITDSELPEPEGPKVNLQTKVYMPTDPTNSFNFVGRILGPDGSTAKCLQQCLGVKIMVRGRGSMRDRKKEEANTGKPNWEHLNENLHVVLTVEDFENRAKARLAKASEYINLFLKESMKGMAVDLFVEFDNWLANGSLPFDWTLSVRGWIAVPQGHTAGSDATVGRSQSRSTMVTVKVGTNERNPQKTGGPPTITQESNGSMKELSKSDTKPEGKSVNRELNGTQNPIVGSPALSTSVKPLSLRSTNSEVEWPKLGTSVRDKSTMDVTSARISINHSMSNLQVFPSSDASTKLRISRTFGWPRYGTFYRAITIFNHISLFRRYSLTATRCVRNIVPRNRLTVNSMPNPLTFPTDYGQTVKSLRMNLPNGLKEVLNIVGNEAKANTSTVPIRKALELEQQSDLTVLKALETCSVNFEVQVIDFLERYHFRSHREEHVHQPIIVVKSLCVSAPVRVIDGAPICILRRRTGCWSEDLCFRPSASVDLSSIVAKDAWSVPSNPPMEDVRKELQFLTSITGPNALAPVFFEDFVDERASFNKVTLRHMTTWRLFHGSKMVIILKSEAQLLWKYKVCKVTVIPESNERYGLGRSYPGIKRAYSSDISHLRRSQEIEVASFRSFFYAVCHSEDNQIMNISRKQAIKFSPEKSFALE
ncbi:protein held out wings [Clonorchis sinensis]|uniref:Protein held out wings n=1 Tax=Clonorchis sinensis TaxID=79923 RepID=G7YPZ9_CLOSI|nr:protein held out wings [Clonorchis sinensis]